MWAAPLKNLLIVDPPYMATGSDVFQWGGRLPPVPFSWCSQAWSSCLTEVANVSGHVRTVSWKLKIKETAACALPSSRVLHVEFDTLWDSRIFWSSPAVLGSTWGIPTGDQSSFSVFILFRLAALSHEWKRFESYLMCSDEFLLVFPSQLSNEYQI